MRLLYHRDKLFAHIFCLFFQTISDVSGWHEQKDTTWNPFRIVKGLMDAENQ